MRSASTASTGSARLILRIDALFEGVLGVVLATSALTGLSSALRLPAPAVEPVMIAVGIVLLPLLPLLWRAGRAPRGAFVRALAVANGVTALVCALWVLIGHGAFHAAGAVFVLVVAGALATLSVAQARLAMATS
jgi:hypothetical protein